MQDRRTPLLLLAGIFLLNAAFFPGFLYTRDSWTMAETAQSLADVHGLALPGPSFDNALRAPNGHWYSVYGWVEPALATPLVWLGWGMQRVLGASLFGQIDDRMYGGRFFLPLFNCLISALIGVQLFRLLRRRVGEELAFFAALGCCFSTLLLPYSRDFFVQPLAALLLLVAVEAASELAENISPQPVIVLAMAMAVLLANRIDGIFAWPLLGGWFFWVLLVRQRTRLMAPRLRLGAIFVAILLIGLGVEFAHNLLRSGTWLFLHRRPDHLFAQSLRHTLPDLLFNPYRSLLLYGPLMLLLIRFRMPTGSSALAGLCLSLATIYGLVYATVEVYFGGVNPGPRYFLPLYVLLFVPLGMQMGRFWKQRAYRLAWGALFSLGAVFNIFESLLDYTRGPSAGGMVARWVGVDDGAWHGFTPDGLRSSWALRMMLQHHAFLGGAYWAVCLGGGAGLLYLAWRGVRRAECKKERKKVDMNRAPGQSLSAERV